MHFFFDLLLISIWCRENNVSANERHADGLFHDGYSLDLWTMDAVKMIRRCQLALHRMHFIAWAAKRQRYEKSMKYFGPFGTARLFILSICHAVCYTIRYKSEKRRERKTIQETGKMGYIILARAKVSEELIFIFYLHLLSPRWKFYCDRTYMSNEDGKFVFLASFLAFFFQFLDQHLGIYRVNMNLLYIYTNPPPGEGGYDLTSKYYH